MVIPSVGAVVLLPFPFSDLSGSKLRPALVLADAGRDDWILCQITSKPYGDVRGIELSPNSFAQGGLSRVSYARPGKLFTAHGRIILRQPGSLKADVFRNIVEAVVDLLQHRA